AGDLRRRDRLRGLGRGDGHRRPAAPSVAGQHQDTDRPCLRRRRDAEDPRPAAQVNRRRGRVGFMPEYDLELEEKLRPLADPLPPPRPGDWLAEHPEPGQTFAEYLDARPVRKSGDLHTIYFCLVGDFSEAQRRILALTEAYLALFFDCPVKVQQQIAWP